MKTLVFAFVIAAALDAQQRPEIDNAKLETRSFSGNLRGMIANLGAGPLWTAWSEPITTGRYGDMCWSNGDFNDRHATGAPVRLEGQTAFVLFVRIDQAKVDQIRVTSPDCRIDAGGLPFYWLTGVPAPESVQWLRLQVNDARLEPSILAIALHADSSATQVLDQLTAPTEPARVRERTAFWLGNSRGAQGLEVLKRMLANDPDTHVREQVVFAISQSRESSALPLLIDEARNDKTPQVRSRALFWLAQKAANKQSLDAVSAAVRNDPDRSVREQAVFALNQMPNGQGVPMLIEVARNNPDPAVRKKAMFWLGESKDPRAVDFFVQVLK